MTLERRSVLVVALLTLALVASVIDGLNSGWTTLSVVGAGCFVGAIVAQLVALRRAKQHS